MNQVSKNSGGHLEKHLTKLCVPCFVLLSPFTVQKVRWRQRLTVDWRQLPRKKTETRQRQVAVCGSGRKHAISCHWSPVRMYPNEAWDSSGPFLNGTSGDGVAVRWRGRETESKELLEQDTLRKRTLEPVFGLAHRGPPGDDLVQMADFGKLTVLILSMFIRESYLFSTMLKKKILEMFRYTRENFMSR